MGLTTSPRPSYTPAPVPSNDADRLEDLYSLGLLDTAAEERYDRYTSLASDIFDAPMALVTLVDRDRQWFKSACGVDFGETERGTSFCGHAVAADETLIVPDTREDSRFAANPLVTGPPYIRFYAGALIHGPAGYPVGTLCIMDQRPRGFAEPDVRRLRELARLIEHEVWAQHELARLREQLRNHALFDEASGLANRTLFMNWLARAIDRAASMQNRVVLGLIELDRFEAIEDAVGRLPLAGLFADAGARLTQALGRECAVARWQDDTLAVLVSGEGSSAPDQAVRRLIECFEDSFDLAGRRHPVRVTVGASVYPDDAQDPDRLVDAAKAALRAAPAYEHSGYRLYTSELSDRVRRRFALEQALRSALDNDEIYVVYQPKIDLASGRITGAEALARWQSPELGAVSPGEFIPIAEERGLIADLGARVLREACLEVRRWHEAGHAGVSMAVNVTGDQLRQPEFGAQVRGILDDAGLSAEHLNLEVTESSLTEDIDSVIAIMQELAELGITFAIDDFGTGFSSLSRLQQMPVELVKIDRSFINQLVTKTTDAALARAIIAMAHGLEIATVAEGVETCEQLSLLRAYRCDQVQGFLYSRPVRAEAFVDLLTQFGVA